MPLQYQTPQLIHSFVQFSNEYAAEQKKWFAKSNSIITLAAKDERALFNFCTILDKKNINYSKFYEPDIGHALAAIALVPGPNNKKACSSLPLAGKYANPLAQERLERRFDLVDAMNGCEQTKGQNVLNHGLSVRDYLFDLINHMRSNVPLAYEWRLPDWVERHRKQFLDGLLDDFSLQQYSIWHDLGKPACKIVDEAGKTHFPNHTDSSAKAWATISDDKLIGRLIKADMDIHLLSDAGVDNFLMINKDLAVSLLLSGLAAIHSNAAATSGLDSTSFKIKYKHLDRRGVAICRRLLESANDK